MYENTEQCYSIKFSVKLEKAKKEAYEMLKEAYGEELVNKTNFYR